MTHALLVNAMVALAIGLAGWLASLKLRDVSFVDSIWGGAMVALALSSWLQNDERGLVANLVLAATALWGLRLAIHLFRRWRATGEDPRYAKILAKDRERGRFALGSLTKVFLLQSLLLFLVCLPAQLAILSSRAGDAPNVLGWGGFAVWALGFTFETVGDAQLARFRAEPASKGKVLDTGLWRYTRHPNYFGDFCVWWGLWLVILSISPTLGLVSVVGPLFLSFTLMKWSGVPLLERKMAERRPGYAEYIRRTSAFFPMPPKG